MYFTRKIFHPEIYQGRYRRHHYFEGWYYKLIDPEQRKTLAVIPGVSYGKDRADSHSFIQIMDATNGRAYYIKYELNEFCSDKDRFRVRIGANCFTADGLELDIHSGELALSGRLAFEHIVSFPRTLLRPGIMGPFSFVPFMECYHDIINIHQTLVGSLVMNGTRFGFNDGYGYVEKDWGRSFPEAWVWLQSNHFEQGNVSIMFSAAKIPWMGRSFTGFLSFLRIGERMYLFSTYSGARLRMANIRDDQIDVFIEDKHFRLQILAHHEGSSMLKAPKNGLMDRVIQESITAVVNTRLTDRSGRLVFEGTGIHAGLEIEEEMRRIFSRE